MNGLYSARGVLALILSLSVPQQGSLPTALPLLDGTPAVTSDVAIPETAPLVAALSPRMPAIDTDPGLPAPGPLAMVSGTVTFQQNVAGYTGAVDTYIDSAQAGTNLGAATTLSVDVSPSVKQTLLRFDNLFGSQSGQIPNNATINSAVLQINVSNVTDQQVGFHRMRRTWAATGTWNTYGAAPWNTTAGIQLDNNEADTVADVSSTFGATGLATVNVTNSVQAWSSNASARFGWVLNETVDNSLVFDSSEAATAAERPKLTVTYTAFTCTTSAECDDGNACTDGACSGGTCIFTNDNTNVCTDSVSCTTDTCSAGACVGSCNCPSGQACNFSTGTCQAPSQLPVAVGESWKYFKGTQNPPSNWKTACFNDASWLTGAGGFGYGPDCNATTHRNTTLSDMQSPPAATGYQSVFARHVFHVPSPGAVFGMNLTVDYDDGFVAYLNGTEIARSVSMGGTVGTQPAFNAAPSLHECSVCDGTCAAAETFSVSAGLLTTGVNVLAIQGHNGTLDSSDFTLVATLVATQPPNAPPNQPTNPAPAPGASGVSPNPQLCVDVSDPTPGETLNVTFFGRPAGGPAGEDFTVIAMPDTQFYAESFPATFNAQTQWIRDNSAPTQRNIVFVTQLGDCVNVGDAAVQYSRADTAFDILENPLTGKPDGIPYGIAVGNHDQAPGATARTTGNEQGTTNLYNATFGLQRICPGRCSNNASLVCEADTDCVSPGICNPGTTCKSYFGGRYDFGNSTTYFRNTDNHYELFSAAGMNFIVFHFEFDDPTDNPTRQAVLQWAHTVLSTPPHNNRRAILSAHYFQNADATWSNQGLATFNAIRDLPNVFMMLSGHRDQASYSARMADDGHVIHVMMSDYQTRPNGGNGWLRILTFSPQNDEIHVETYSPTIGRFIDKPLPAHADNMPGAGGNELFLDYDMDSGTPFTTIGTNLNVPSGTRTCRTWNGPQGPAQEWYVTISDGTTTTTGPRWNFTTSCTSNAQCNDNDVCDGVETCVSGACVNGTPPNCVDTNPCTRNDCNPTTGCSNPADDTLSCSDNNACNGAESCVSGVCQQGTPPSCTDTNPCTDNSCSPATGCVVANNTAPCTDDNTCTTPDVCSGGACTTTYAPTIGCCVADADCNDGNPATSDTCTTGRCRNATAESCATNGDCDDNAACTQDTCDLNTSALSFNGTNQYVSAGAANGPNGLNASPDFTIEAWIQGSTGDVVTTGSLGIDDVIPLVTKGRGQVDDVPTFNMNYFLGLKGGKLVADFEEAVNGTNHPICATTEIPNPTAWHHVAATYDGECWQLYVDGQAQTTIDQSCSNCTTGCPQPPFVVCPDVDPEPDSEQRFSIGSALRSFSNPEDPDGYFAGKIDEVRIWNVARTAGEIQANMTAQLPSGTGLIGRFSLDEGSGGTAGDSAPNPTANDGTLTNGPTWVTDPAGLPALGEGSCRFDAIEDCCTEHAQCDDGLPCTADACAFNHCEHASIDGCCLTADDCDDANVCTAESCDNTNHCVYSPANQGGECDDGSLCTSGDVCSNGTCAGTVNPATCGDSVSCTADSCSEAANGALPFNGSGYVTAGAAPELNVSPQFTIETWFLWDGGGTPPTGDGTGGGGMSAIPLVTKGRAEGETPANRNMNYFLGISGGRLAADFEDAATGLNHPACALASTAQITTGVWHHAAAVFDGTCWHLYLDGNEQPLNPTCGTCAGAACNTCPVSGGAVPEPNSIQRFALGSALTTAVPEAPSGFFSGRLDEVRIWNTGRSAAEILANRDRRIASALGLVGRFGLDDGSGTTARDSSGNGSHGTLTNLPVNPWTAGALALGSVQCTNTPAPDCCTSNPHCNDDNTCTSETCNTSASTCQRTNLTGPCNDNSACTVNDACGGGSCTGTEIPSCCDNAAECADGNDCTAEACSGNVAAVDLAQTTDYVNLGNFGNAAPTTTPNYLTHFGTSSFTVEGWFWANSATASLINIVRHGRQGNNPQVVVQTAGPTPFNKLQASVETTTTGTQIDTPTTASTFSLNAWHHFAAVVDRSPTNQKLLLYLDGALVSSVTNIAVWGTSPSLLPINDTIASSTYDPVLLGVTRAADGTLTPNFNGRVDEIRIWDHARTAQEVLDNRDRQILSAPGLKHRWAFNEGSGSTAADTGDTPTVAAILVNPGATPWRTGADIPVLRNECRYSTTNEGGTCLDFDACTTQTTCTGGNCGGGSPVVCSDTNDCTTDYCDSVDGCRFDHNNVGCDDGNACTVDDACSGGACGGTTRICNDLNACTADSCDPLVGCVYSEISCNDGVFCNGVETCDSFSGCQFGPPPSCDDGVDCTGDICDPATDECVHQLDHNFCGDDNFCNGDEICHPTLDCQPPSSPRNCADNIACTQDSCDPSLDACVNPPHDANCDDGLYCNGFEWCDGNDGCHPAGAPPEDDDEIACTIESCDEVNDVIVHTPTNSECQDGNFCNGAEVCSPTADCQPGTPPESDDGIPCTADSCNEQNDTIVHSPNHALCNNGLFCDGTESCNPTAGCQSGAAPNCADTNSCTADGCSNSLAQCTHESICCVTTADCDDQSSCTTNVCNTKTDAALSFDGSNDRVIRTGADNPALGATQFTLEAWIYWLGGGDTAGTGGTTGYPIIAKGRTQAENSTQDTNYFFGIRSPQGTLTADFEEGSGQTSPGLNHPIHGGTVVTQNVWHHVAATYDGTTWRLYLDGNPDGTLVVGANRLPRADSIQRFAVGAALTSTGSADGAFRGSIDEVRVWKRALSPGEILAGKFREVTTGTDLALRWALNETSGSSAADSAGSAENGTVQGALWQTTNLPPIGNDQCVFDPVVCNDNNACTDDTCPGPGGCLFQPDSGNTCSDGLNCTTDTCTGGNCISTAIVCNDSNPCTDDTCNPSTGLCGSAADNTNTCNDNNPCTDFDICQNGACVCVEPCNGVTATFTGASPRTIPTGPGVVTAPVTVSAAGAWLQKLRVTTNIRHTSSNHLDVTLTSPAGTIVTLTTDNGGSLDHVFGGTVWDDKADPNGALPYTTNPGLASDHPYSNNVTATPLVPEEALAAFTGENPNGVWTLTISDDTSGTGGTLQSWSLEVTTLPTPPTRATATFSNTSNLSIADEGMATTSITVSGLSNRIGDVRVRTFLRNDASQDFDVTLRSPLGTIVTLTTGNGSNHDHVFDGTWWDDNADPDGLVPYSSNAGLATDHPYQDEVAVPRLAPEEALGAFAGESANGVWTLTIVNDDDARASLNGWSLEIVTEQCVSASCTCD